MSLPTIACARATGMGESMPWLRWIPRFVRHWQDYRLSKRMN